MPRKAKRQATIDATKLLDDPELAARHKNYVSRGLTLDPKARWYRAKNGYTVVMTWRKGSFAVIETTRVRDTKEKAARA